MKFNVVVFLLSIFFLSCQNTTKQSEASTSSGPDSALYGIADSSANMLEAPVLPQAAIAITSNALHVVSLPSGSTKELPVGMEMDQVLEIVSKVLESEIPEPQVNSECGSGPMTMSIFENGLVLLFQKTNSNQGKMEFVGWSLSDRGNGTKVTTMAGIGIGSTRADLESVYNVKIEETTLGMEFSTVPGGLYGIIDGKSESSKISFMWSGMSCNFR